MDDLNWDQAETIYVSAEAWDELQRQLAEPPRVIPALRDLYARRSPIENDDD